MSESRKKLTFISRRAPYAEDYPRACLDMVMAAAVFEQDVSYLFLGDGVYQLLPEQQADAIRSKSLGAHLGALSLYGVEKLYVDGPALASRELDPEALAVPAEVLDQEALQELIADSDQVFVL